MKGKKTLAVLLSAAALLAAGKWGLGKLGEKRILFPPQITCQVLLEREPVSAGLLVNQANTGVYQFTCRYGLADGAVTLAERDCWQSYEDTVSRAEYRKFRSLSDKTLTRVQRTGSGYLLIFHGNPAEPVTVMETDGAGNVTFSYDFDGVGTNAVFQSAISGDDGVYALAYLKDTDTLTVTGVDRSGVELLSVGFTYDQLSGEESAEKRMGGFLFDGDNVLIRNGVLYFGAACYSESPGAVIGAYDLSGDASLYYQKLDGAQMAAVRWEEDRFSVLVNRKRFTPLEVHTFSMADFSEQVTLLPLPEEFTACPWYSEGYYLFPSAMTSHRAAVVLDDPAGAPDGLRRVLLAVWDTESGEMVYRCRLTLDADYDIYGLELAS
ncbi:hypothetical protein [Dysosmobacter sp.]|uniref:hypothetical protein n=1 Tax=Dysosmobacter sp. TaxID=2591382 RepID=UPI002A863986|nr:hypothetical protein [Dysosmobacter sp.]MDY3281975.1 hypothetical protein [Dysosmobacter sp.]